MQQITLKAMSIQAINDEDIGTVKVKYCAIILTTRVKL